MDAMITVKRADLLEKLTALIDQYKREFDESEKVKEYEDLKKLLQAGETREAFEARMLAWHKQIVDGLEKGTITITSKGAPHNGPPKPVINKFLSHGFYERHWTVEACDKQIEQYKEYLEADLKPLQTAIEILLMSQDELIPINSGDYQSLLSGKNRRRYY